MKKLLVAGITALALTGCTGLSTSIAGLSTSIGGVNVKFTSNPLASALSQCAVLAEILTPGVNIGAAADLARGIFSDNALGNTPQGGMRNCAALLDAVAD